MMTEVTQRISRYLLARLRRAAIHDIYEHAAVAGLLESAFIDQREQTGVMSGEPARERLDEVVRPAAAHLIHAAHPGIRRAPRR